MKAKLINRGNGDYKLYVDETTYATTSDNPYKKLSKQNCDEIFGVVDTKEVIAKKMNDYNIVDKAVDFSNANPENNGAYLSYIAGAYEAFSIMESNKDKVFTLDDMKLMFEFGYRKNNLIETTFESALNFIQSLQQPTEIDVEIEMKKVVDETKVIGAVKGVKGSGDKITTYKSIPKLDSNGCLILKRAE